MNIRKIVISSSLVLLVVVAILVVMKTKIKQEMVTNTSIEAVGTETLKQTIEDSASEKFDEDKRKKKDKASLEVLIREVAVDGKEKEKRQKNIKSSVGKEIDVSVHYKNMNETNKNALLKVDFSTDELEYIPNSLHLRTANQQEGKFLDDSNIGEWIDIGGYQPRGDAYLRFRCKIKKVGPERYGGNIKINAISFDDRLQSDWASIYPENADIQVNQFMRLKGSEDWEDSIMAIEGDLIEFRIWYKNRCPKAIKKAYVQVILPKNLEYISGSARLTNKNHWKGNAEWKDSDEEILDSGVNIEGYNQGEEAFITYTARVINRDLIDNEENSIMPKAKITADGIANECENELIVSN